MSVTLKKITTLHPSYAFVEDVFVSSFPECERRPVCLQRQYIDTDSNEMLCYLICQNDAPAGFITAWQFAEFTYIEHFAISSGLRSGGIGSKALKLFMETVNENRPLLLEVELPQNDLAQKRISFYSRLGLQLQSDEYLQPPYPGADEWVPLMLMTYNYEAFDVETVKNRLYKNVYQQP